tara:strand:- start:137 stop:358 length:222 start_codon:yes stop_codon:yes gene_type:complete
MGIDIKIRIETIKGVMEITKTPDEVKLLYKFILDEIRDLEVERDEKKNAQKIKMLDNILDMLGTMLLAAAEEH